MENFLLKLARLLLLQTRCAPTRTGTRARQVSLAGPGQDGSSPGDQAGKQVRKPLASLAGYVRLGPLETHLLGQTPRGGAPPPRGEGSQPQSSDGPANTEAEVRARLPQPRSARSRSRLEALRQAPPQPRGLPSRPGPAGTVVMGCWLPALCEERRLSFSPPSLRSFT